MEDILKTDNLPKHIAITMDGNGRWAREKGRNRIFGHNQGVEAVRDTIEGAVEYGIKYLTLFAFSTENWKRPKHEVDALMQLLISSISKETETLLKNNIKLEAIGNIKQLPKKCQTELNECINQTKENNRMTLVLALSYSGKWEILNAINQIVKSKSQKSKISIDDFEQYLSTKNVPDPELLIRTSGEKRISNFMLWQIAYSELYFTEKKWPDFRKEDLKKAIIDYQKRDRRFGATK